MPSLKGSLKNHKWDHEARFRSQTESDENRRQPETDIPGQFLLPSLK